MRNRHALVERPEVCDRLAAGSEIAAVARTSPPAREFFVATNAGIRLFAECIDDLPAGDSRVLALRVQLLRAPVARAVAGDPGDWVDLGEEVPVDTFGPLLNRTDFRRKLEELQKRW